MKNKKIGILVGSLRKDSFNRKVAENVIELSEKYFDCELIEIGKLPLYNQDEDSSPSTDVIHFREHVRSCDGILFFTPEYNRSIPGVLKNAIDIGSRPYGQSVWTKKPAGIISVSIGSIGGFGANHHLRQCLVFLDMPCMQQPELYIGNASKLFNEIGLLSDEVTKELLKKFIQSYDNWINIISPEQQISYKAKGEIHEVRQ